MDEVKDLVEIFLKAKTKTEMEDLLLGLLTPKEMEEFTKRVEIVKLLKKGIPQHTIAKKLGVGIGTVTRGSHQLKLKRFKIIS